MTDDVAYWRTLAEERQRQLEVLRARLLAAVDTIPDAHVRALVSALDARPEWLRDLDSMTALNDLAPGDIVTILDDLWRRVAADTPA